MLGEKEGREVVCTRVGEVVVGLFVVGLLVGLAVGLDVSCQNWPPC